MKGYLCENCNAFDTERIPGDSDLYEVFMGRRRMAMVEGWLRLITENTVNDFCSLECVLAWLLRMHSELPKGHG